MKNTRILIVLLLAAALLCGCGAPQAVQTAGEETPAASEENVVLVSDVASFLGALAPDTVIEIDAEYLLLDRAPDYGFGYSAGAYTWQQTDPGEYTLVIRDLEGLTIRGRGMGQTTLSTASRTSDVLRFENCSALTLEGVTLGHRGEVSGCAGDVTSFNSCEDVTLRGCELFGCGVIAVNAYLCARLYLEGCTLRDCTMAALNITCCTDFQARECEILRCGKSSWLAALCVASCNGFALINSTISGCDNTFLLDAMNSPGVCLLGCEATGSRFSNALFSLYDYNITVSGSALSGNEFGSCYGGGAWAAETAAGQELITFADFARMELKPYTGEYVGPAVHVTPGDASVDPYVTPGEISLPCTEWDGDRTEVHVTTVDELLAALAPHTTIFLDGEEFDLSAASDYGTGYGEYYGWVETFDGPQLVLHDLEDFSLIGGGMGVTLVSAVPRYADVLSFENCRGFSIEDMTIGHYVEPGYCSGDVLAFSWCEGVTIMRCGLFGCGEIGVNASCGSNFFITDTNIYDCSSYGAWLNSMQSVQFSGCSVTNCGGNYGCNGIILYDSSGVFYDARRLLTGENLIEEAP